jgi:hypothetical protein
MSASGSRLEALTKQLHVDWQQTKTHWHDVKSQEFEQTYLQELMSTVDKSVAAIDQLDKLLSKITKDCE